MSENRRWLTIRLEDGPVWRQLLVGIGRAVAIYVGIGVGLGFVARIFLGPDAWNDFESHENIAFAMVWWGLGWPLIALLSVFGHG